MQIRPQDYPYTDVKCTTRDAVKVVGTTNAGECERIATQADQATQTGHLSTISGYTANLPTIASALESKLYVTAGGEGFGFNSVGSGFEEDNKSPARLKFQTQNIQRHEVTEEASAYDIDKVSAPDKLNCAEINQISIAGFNLSTDTALQFTFYFWNETNSAYEPFYDYVVGYGSPNYNAENRDIKFFPNIVGDWNADDRRYGYFEVVTRGTATTPNHLFYVNITVTPFNKS
jgi:hypothetical protein